VVVAVADGVGSRPCDWRASEVACEAAMEGIAEASGPLPEQIEAGIDRAHWTVGRETGRCEGMLAAIVVAAWPRGADEIFHAGVGDARIYRIYPGRVEQITEDDKETKTIRQDTRTSLPGAPSTYRRDFLTQALGGEYDLGIEVHATSFPPGAGVALASDGAYPLGGFESKLRRVFERPRLEETLTEWLDPQSLGNEDDATLALLRRSGLTIEMEERYLNLLGRMADCRDEDTHPHLMTRVLLKELDRALQDGDEERIGDCARYMGRFSIQPGQGALADLLDRIAENPECGKGTFERLLEVARQGR
jgi:serine/threonine protein phosphatase PrpC